MAKIIKVEKAGVDKGRVDRVYWICSKCERAIPAHSRFCLWCGVKLSA